MLFSFFTNVVKINKPLKFFLHIAKINHNIFMVIFLKLNKLVEYHLHNTEVNIYKKDKQKMLKHH